MPYKPEAWGCVVPPGSRAGLKAQSWVWGGRGLPDAELYCGRPRVGVQGKVLCSLSSLLSLSPYSMVSLSTLCCLGLGEGGHRCCKTVLPTLFNVSFLVIVLPPVTVISHLVFLAVVKLFSCIVVHDSCPN